MAQLKRSVLALCLTLPGPPHTVPATTWASNSLSGDTFSIGVIISCVPGHLAGILLKN